MKPIPLTETQMAELFRLREENAALKEQVAQLEAACISGFYHERVPQFSQGFPNHEVLELVTAKEVQAYVDRIETLQSKSALVDALESWLNIAGNCSIESGCCCCGESMEKHASPMDCGHSPVDMSDAAVDEAIKRTEAALAAFKGEK